MLLHVATNGGDPTSSSDVLDVEPGEQQENDEQPEQGNQEMEIISNFTVITHNFSV